MTSRGLHTVLQELWVKKDQLPSHDEWAVEQGSIEEL